MTDAQRQPIIVADSGPLIRLAAAGLLDALRVTNRRIVLIDRIEDEVTGDLSKPHAETIKTWLDTMGDAVERVQTVYGNGIEALRNKQRTPKEDAMLKGALRNSGELALFEFMESWRPEEGNEAIVVYEDKRIGNFMSEVDYHVTLVTTRAFARLMQQWGVNANAVLALENISGEYSLKPALFGQVDPDVPPDMRMLPQPMNDETP
jgi:hypothetical protein